MELKQSTPMGYIKGSIWSSMFHVWQEIPEKGWQTHLPKHCEYDNYDEDNSPITQKDKNYQASSKNLDK